MVTVIHVASPKVTGAYEPYMEFCQRCKATYSTRIIQTRGMCWWISFAIGFLFFPIWYWLCYEPSKDTKHYCSRCGNLLAIRRGGC